MAISEYTRKGSLQIVDVPKVLRNGSLYIAHSRIANMLQWKWSIIGEAIANPMFYLLSVGIGIGKFVNSHQARGIDGVKYLVFLAPALLASACIIGASNAVMHPTLEGFKWNKNFFAMNATPISARQIANGVLLGAIARATFGTVVYYLALLIFGGVHGLRSFWLLPATIYSAAAFAAMMLGICAAIENSDLLMNIVNRLLIMPLFLFSGTFYSLSTMPKFLQLIGWLSPLWHATEVGRAISYGHHLSPLAITIHLAYMTIMLVGGLIFAHHHFKRRLSK